MMKIAIVRQSYNPYGGAERFVERALSALLAEGTEVTLITRSWNGVKHPGFRQLTCNPSYSKILGGRAARDKSFAAAARLMWEREEFDIIQSHERVPGCNIFRAGDGVHAAWLKRRERILGKWQRLGQEYSAYHRYVCATEKKMLRHPALKRVICNSQMVADEMTDFYGVPAGKLSVIYNGVDTDVFHPNLALKHRTLKRQDAGIPQDAPVLLYVGSGFERKGVPQLLIAAANMTRKEAHLVIVGADRRLKQEVKRAESLGLSNRVHFTGPVEDVRPWYGVADGFVLPTLYDPCPNAALEAMASGLPVVLSDACGAKEWVRAGVNGWVVDPLSIDDLAAALDRLVDLSGCETARLSARTAVASLTLEAMAQRLISLYRECL